MRKISFELKLKIVKENQQGHGTESLSKQYGINKATIKNWVKQYEIKGIDGLKKSMSKTKYTGEFKLSVLQYRQIHSLSYKETAKHFKIKNPSTIANWKRKYESEGFQGLNNQVGRPKLSGDPNMPKKDKIRKVDETELEELIRLREENMYLRARLEYEK